MEEIRVCALISRNPSLLEALKSAGLLAAGGDANGRLTVACYNMIGECIDSFTTEPLDFANCILHQPDPEPTVEKSVDPIIANAQLASAP